MRVVEEGKDTEGSYPTSHVMVHVHFLGNFVGLLVLLKFLASFLLLVAGATATWYVCEKKR